MFDFYLFLLRVGQAVSLSLDADCHARFALVSCRSNSVLSAVVLDYKTQATHPHRVGVLRCFERPFYGTRLGRTLPGLCGGIAHRCH